MTQSATGSSMGFLSWLTLMLIGLKLAGFITWSWWLVFAPVWGTFLLALLIGIVAGYMAVTRKPKSFKQQLDESKQG